MTVCPGAARGNKSPREHEEGGLAALPGTGAIPFGTMLCRFQVRFSRTGGYFSSIFSLPLAMSAFTSSSFLAT